MKITDLRAGVEYAVRRYPKSPQLVGHIRLLGTSKTEDYTYDTGWSGERIRTKALPAVSINDGDGREFNAPVLPKHIIATWEDYLAEMMPVWYEEARADQARKERDERVTIIVNSYQIVGYQPDRFGVEVLLDGRVAVEFHTDDGLLDQVSAKAMADVVAVTIRKSLPTEGS